MPQRGNNSKKMPAPKMKATLGNKTNKPNLKPVAFRLPEKLKGRVVQTMALREEHQKQLDNLQMIVADNSRAINNLVIGWLSGKDEIQIEDYHIQLSDDGGTVMLVPKTEGDAQPPVENQQEVPATVAEDVEPETIVKNDTDAAPTAEVVEDGKDKAGEA